MLKDADAGKKRNVFVNEAGKKEIVLVNITSESYLTIEAVIHAVKSRDETRL